MYKSCSFEVFGKVQKVYFRKYTQEEAQRIGLVGWVMNTPHQTVVGEMQGTDQQIEDMKDWLRTKGSPMSTIERAEFKDTEIDTPAFKDFEFRR